jgi:uncharacterized protein with HEPN domain
MKRKFKFFIEDIIEAIDDIEEFIAGMDFPEFYRDNKTKSAVVWKVETIGEAAKNTPKEIKEKYKDIPWKDMSGIRDKIAHFYFGIDYEIVWEVIKKRLPEIKLGIKQILKDIEQRPERK